MPALTDPANLSVGQFAEKFRGDDSLRKPFSYYFAALPLTDEDIREYLEEPIAALPASVLSQLPKVSILLVPYLEKGREKGTVKLSEVVRMEKPTDNRVSWTSCVLSEKEAVLAFALKDQEVADYHYRFYHLLAELVADQKTEDGRKGYAVLLRDELTEKVNGEVDEESWHLKQTLTRRPLKGDRESKAFRDYSRQSFIDTMTLYLHGLCCDIDVETGPRQLPSRYVRKRLNLVRALYPSHDGYAVFPEDMKDR
ncbi:MAG: hypothetical protein WKF37_14975 [Bryobacteraceae bacterium]